jgi:hypothetical protein
MRSLALRLRPQLFFALPLLFGIAEGCASISSSDGSGVPTTGLIDSGPGGVTVVDGGISRNSNSDSGAEINKLCGFVGRCPGGMHQPDDATACANFMPQAATGGSGGGSTVLGTGGASSTGGTGGRPSSTDGGAYRDGGDASFAGDARGEPGAGRDGGLLDGGPGPGGFGAGGSFVVDRPGIPDARTPYSPTPEVDAGALYSCQVLPADKGAPFHDCVRAGVGGPGASCLGASDCRAGLACVGTAGAGQCQRYCCNENNCKPIERADGGTTPTFCTERPLLETQSRGGAMLDVPVCMPVDECRLNEKADCAGEGCKKCPLGEACAVVNPEGKTSCVKPGNGRGGDACPCAAGYHCSAATKLCIKYCQPGVTDSLCDPGKCQAAAGLPDGFGLCVSSSPAVR